MASLSEAKKALQVWLVLAILCLSLPMVLCEISLSYEFLPADSSRFVYGRYLLFNLGLFTL